jgi:hypothetical protein
VFEATSAEEVLDALQDIYPDMEAPPPEPAEPIVPMFLRKENPMSNEETVQPAGLPSLVVANTAIRQDREGRYCLNDLHKAAGGENRHRPSLWLENQQTQELVEEITKAVIPALEQNQPVSVVKGGSSPGTYVCKELVYAYAMWISAKFHLTVIRAFDALVTGRKPEAGSNALPEICEEACDARAWFLFNQARQSILALLGNSAREGDDERLLDGLFWIKTRLQERLRKQAMRQLASRNDPQKVAAWVLAWTPDRPALA